MHIEILEYVIEILDYVKAEAFGKHALPMLGQSVSGKQGCLAWGELSRCHSSECLAAALKMSSNPPSQLPMIGFPAGAWGYIA